MYGLHNILFLNVCICTTAIDIVLLITISLILPDDTLGNASSNGLLDNDNKEVVFNTLQPRTKD